MLDKSVLSEFLISAFVWKHLPPVGVRALSIRGNVMPRTEAQNKLVATAQPLYFRISIVNRIYQRPRNLHAHFTVREREHLRWVGKGNRTFSRRVKGWDKPVWGRYTVDDRKSVPAKRKIKRETRGTLAGEPVLMRKQKPAARRVQAILGNVKRSKLRRPKVSIVWMSLSH